MHMWWENGWGTDSGMGGARLFGSSWVFAPRYIVGMCDYVRMYVSARDPNLCTDEETPKTAKDFAAGSRQRACIDILNQFGGYGMCKKGSVGGFSKR